MDKKEILNRLLYVDSNLKEGKIIKAYDEFMFVLCNVRSDIEKQKLWDEIPAKTGNIKEKKQ